MELNIIFPNSEFIKINKEELKKNMKYITVKRNQNQPIYVFLDECKYTGHTFTFLRSKVFILSQNQNDSYETKIINEEITLDSSYFNSVEIYKFVQIILNGKD